MFITFEGGEGTGKSTQSKLLLKAFEDAGIDVVYTREPGGSEGAENIRNLLVNGDVARWDPVSELSLHLAARRDHIEKLIRPALANKKYVICDRFIDSTMAYQGYGHNLGREYVNMMQNMIIGNFLPDITLVFDADVETCMKRAQTRGDKENRYEKMGVDFHKRVREGFLATARNEPDRCIIINANKEISSISQDIIDIINRKSGSLLKMK